jgi:hypothetical protein
LTDNKENMPANITKSQKEESDNEDIEPLHINIRKNIPGPGTYEQGIEINKYGVYRLSTIENSRAAAWSPSKKRFEDDLRHKRSIPGPGDYYPSD